MISLIRRCAAGLVVALGFSVPASAATSGVDFTDLWWNPNESGWGMQLIQQNNIMFSTLFVYGADSSARWFVASNLQGSGNGFTGTLFQTTGPAFNAGAFNPNAVTVTPVGTMTIAFNTPNTGTLTYSVNGQTVTKQIQRQTWANENLSGSYLGGLTATSTNCGNGATNGAVLIFDNLTVSQSATTATFTVNFNNSQGTASVCNFSGPYTQNGRLGTVSGNFSCTFGTQAGNNGTFNLTQIQPSQNGFTGAFQGSDQFCQYNGFFGGLRDVPH